ncbi:glycoside hydrolase 43 family protein [Shivajiella indica]|uniref:Glycoside hydrolase 43 family protein n=1 Tax=Shivajiella indica TaxID=872115 RepID=A0ABW5B518_9BACT
MNYNSVFFLFSITFLLSTIQVMGQEEKAKNPIIFADVPDLSMIRVGETYYMSSTTMHMAPGVPIMKSIDLTNWKLVNYAYETLVDNRSMNLIEGKNAYGRGSWASCLRYFQGYYYVSTFSQTSGKTHIFKTQDIEQGPWDEISFEPSHHDHSIFFEEDGKVYMIWGAGTIKIVELKNDLSGVVPGTEKVLIQNASAPAEGEIMLPAEGSQLFKVNGYYYLFHIVWPKDGMRTVLVHRSKNIEGPYEGKVMLEDRGIAQGGLIDTPDGKWFAYLFRDYGAVGRIPYLVPVTWKEDWPILGEDGKVPEKLDLPKNQGLMPGLVASDEFDRTDGQSRLLPLVWQWNHNPVNEFWSLEERSGFLRLKTNRVDKTVLEARNTLTQRTFGPKSNGVTKLDVSGMKDGDYSGLLLLQKEYGFVGVKQSGDKKSIVIVLGNESMEKEVEELPLENSILYLKASCDFENLKDQANFFYSFDGIQWHPIGETLYMKYTLPHFMGYRFGLFYFGTKRTDGFVDFDFFRIGEGQ